MDKLKVLSEIKGFLEGYNGDLKYIVNVEADPSVNYAECVIHEPDKSPRIQKIGYEPFVYVKDLKKLGIDLYEGYDESYIQQKQVKYGITITKLKTGNQKRLVDGFCYKVTSTRSYNAIINYFTDGGLNPFEKVVDSEGRPVKNKKGEVKYLHRDKFHNLQPVEQFFVSTQSRLFKGFEEYKQVHKLTFDCETTGLRYQLARLFAIGVRDNRGFETILEVEKTDDDEAEIRLIQKFFNLIDQIRPAVIAGYNSEMFDFEFILGRAKILKMDLSQLPMGLREGIGIGRRGNTSVKYGNTADRYTATKMWGYSIIDIMHAAKKTAAVNSELKATGLKYVAKFEKIAKPNRTYIKGEDNSIGRFYGENKIFAIDEKNVYIQLPEEYQAVGRNLYNLQENKKKLTDDEYKHYRTTYLNECPEFVNWFRAEAMPKNMNRFISGKRLLRQYLLDDLWETEQVDELYNQSSFMLAKIVPTTYHRICTMGTAAIWNLLMTAWSYENDIAIPDSDVNVKFSGGLARCYKSGFTKRIVKIDYASLYPMLQLTWDIFPMFDITGVLKKMLLYLTTTRNIYKKLANGTDLNTEELTLVKQIDHEVYEKYLKKAFTPEDIAMFKVKQLPIKILNNSLFGALGSGVSFNWSDNICAARITCCGRLELRHSISWFKKYNCIALLAVTDGVNFQFPELTNIRVTDQSETVENEAKPIEEMWQYRGKRGINAIIEKFNDTEMRKPYMAVDNDGESISCLNLSRINYATMALAKDKKTGEMKEKIKLTGNTIKSKVMPEYIEEFIDKGLDLILHGKGKEFVEYYNDYAKLIYYKQIPLKKIASKSKIKNSLTAYLKRGKDKNGREKGKQAHMELLLEKRRKIAAELFELNKKNLIYTKSEDKLTPDEKMKLVVNYMPAEPELDSVVYYYNTGTKVSQGNSSEIEDPVTGEKRYCSQLITAEELIENPTMTGNYNVAKYLDSFNKRVKTILVGFDPEVRVKLLAKIVKDKKTKEVDLKCGGEDFASYKLELMNFDLNDYDESMYLEPKEVEFWNKSGYDPRKVWNGFKMYDDDRVYFEIYEHALNYLNEKMSASGKPRIKSINEPYGKGDLILIKNDKEFSIGAHNGSYIEIIRTNDQLNIPKSDLEIELEKKKEEEEQRIRSLELTLDEKTEKEKELETQKQKREKYFGKFKKLFNLSSELSIEEIYKEEPMIYEMLDDFVLQQEDEEDEEDADNLDGENEDGDGAY